MLKCNHFETDSVTFINFSQYFSFFAKSCIWRTFHFKKVLQKTEIREYTDIPYQF